MAKKPPAPAKCARCNGTGVSGVSKVYHPLTGKVVSKTPIPCTSC